jgi:ABC-2 type transport system ATP-binding protein
MSVSRSEHAGPAVEMTEEDRAEPAIQATEVSKAFDGHLAVRNVSFTVPSGSIFGYVGPSGSGKTTTVRLLTGVYPPTEGSLQVLGKDPRLFTAGDRARLGYMPQLSVLYPDLTVAQNLSFAASIYGMVRRRHRLSELLDFVELEQDRGKVVGKISGGMQRRLSLAATLLHDPDLLFLDEPTAGVDPVLRRKFWDRFRELRDEGKTLFITTQVVSEAAYCDLVGVMVGDGRLLAVDSPEGLRRRAFQGDLVEIRSGRAFRPDELAELSRLPFARGPVRLQGERSLILPVDEARRAIPEILAWTSEHGLPVDEAEELAPSYDDVFVRLMEEAGDKEADLPGLEEGN